MSTRTESRAHRAHRIRLPSGGRARVYRVGGVVHKTHAPDTELDQLLTRLAVAADPALRTVFLSPISVYPTVADGRLVTSWPAARPVATDPALAPWAAAGRLLARLHRVPPDDVPAARKLPPAGGPARVARAVPAAGVVRKAWLTLPDWARHEAPQPARALVHGDWHLGQLVEHGRRSPEWRLIDIDDLGLGEPAWDLGRPAALFAVGLLHPRDWAEFLAAYRAGGGPAADEAIDLAARAYTIHAAAHDHDPLFIDACRRIAGEEEPK